MKISSKALRKIIREEILAERASLKEKIQAVHFGKSQGTATGGSSSKKSASVSGDNVGSTAGVDDCWNNLGNPIKSSCNLDSFTIGGAKNYRSAKPGKNSGSGKTPPDRAVLQHMKDKWGIERIIDLTNDSREERLASDLGLQYISSSGGYGEPDSGKWETMKIFLSRGNTLIHCTHGADRTGAYVARAKIEMDRIATTVALKDAKRYGFKTGPGQNRRLNAWINDDLGSSEIE